MTRYYLRAPTTTGPPAVVKVGSAAGGVSLEVDGRRLALTPRMARDFADALIDSAEADQ